MATTEVKRVPVFGVGLWTDSNGRVEDWTEEKIDAWIAAYEEARPQHFTPIPMLPATEDSVGKVQVSHDNKVPAFGWVERFFREGETVFADYAQVAVEFAQALKDGAWKKVSMGFMPANHPSNPVGKLLPWHVAYVHKPALNLPVPTYQATLPTVEDGFLLTFSISDLADAPTTAPSTAIADLDPPAIASLLEQFETKLDALTNTVNLMTTDKKKAQETESLPEQIPPDYEARFAALEKSLTGLQTENAELKKQVESAESRVKASEEKQFAAEQARDRAQVESTVDKWILEERYAASDKQRLVTEIMAMPHDKAIAFSADEGVAQKTPREQYMATLGAKEPMVTQGAFPQFQSSSGGGDDPNADLRKRLESAWQGGK